MEINIQEYLSTEEMKDIVEDEVRKHIRSCIGGVSVGNDRAQQLITTMAKQLAKDGVQELIPNFKELINEHIVTQIGNIKLSEMFVQSMGWQSTGNKILNGVLSDNKALIDAKMKEIFSTVDK